MVDFEEELKNIIENDPLGLLDVKPKSSSVATPDERLVASFLEVNQFVAENGREPQAGGGVQEHQLFSRLKGIRENPEKVEALESYDDHGLLKKAIKEVKTIDDVFADDSGLLDGPEDIFSLKHVSYKPKAEADEIAQRKPCKNFAEYEPLFRKVHEELREGKRQLLEFNDRGEKLVAGNFYILSGMLLYLEDINITSPEKTIEGKRFRKDGRTKTIFENGNESNMLYRSLAKQLYNDGRVVTNTNEQVNEDFYESMQASLTEEDKEAGFVYVLSSLSTDERIQSIADLYKIGFSREPIEERIKNAQKDPTYLMADVKLEAGFQCYNMSPQKFEKLIHQFFGAACVNFDIYDGTGKRHTPREWFVAPIEVIHEAIKLIISGEVTKYKYDVQNQQIIERKN